MQYRESEGNRKREGTEAGALVWGSSEVARTRDGDKGRAERRTEAMSAEGWGGARSRRETPLRAGREPA